jgi:hypothetical protein
MEQVRIHLTSQDNREVDIRATILKRDGTNVTYFVNSVNFNNSYSNQIKSEQNIAVRSGGEVTLAALISMAGEGGYTMSRISGNSLDEDVEEIKLSDLPEYSVDYNTEDEIVEITFDTVSPSVTAELQQSIDRNVWKIIMSGELDPVNEINSLVPGVTYYFKVRLISSEGGAPYSAFGPVIEFTMPEV